MTILILDKDAVTSNDSGKYNYRFDNEIKMRSIQVKSCLVTHTSSYNLLYVRSNLNFNKRIIAGTDGRNRRSNILAVLQNSDPSLDSNTVTSTSSVTKTFANDEIKLNTSNDDKIYSGSQIFLISDTGGIASNTGTGNNRTITLKSSSGRWKIKILNRSTGNDKLQIFDDDTISSYTIFDEKGIGTNEELESTYDTITIEYNPNTDETGFTIIAYEHDSVLTDDGTDYTATKTTDVAKVIKYNIQDPTLFKHSVANSSIRDIDLEFYNGINSETPIDVSHFSVILEIS